MKIKLKLNNDTLIACNNLLKQVYNSETPPNEAGKLIKSICFEVADKFDTKAKSLVKSANLFDKKNTTEITLKWYEAWGTLQVFIRLNEIEGSDFQKLLVQKVISTINQKLT